MPGLVAQREVRRGDGRREHDAAEEPDGLSTVASAAAAAAGAERRDGGSERGPLASRRRPLRRRRTRRSAEQQEPDDEHGAAAIRTRSRFADEPPEPGLRRERDPVPRRERDDGVLAAVDERVAVLAARRRQRGDQPPVGGRQAVRLEDPVAVRHHDEQLLPC